MLIMVLSTKSIIGDFQFSSSHVPVGSKPPKKYMNYKIIIYTYIITK